MLKRCPHGNLSYATWRLQVFDALYRKGLENCTLESSLFFDSRRRYSTTPACTKDVPEIAHTTERPDPSRDDKMQTKCDGAPNPFSRESISGMQDVLAKVKDLSQTAADDAPTKRNESYFQSRRGYRSPVRHILKPGPKEYKRMPTKEEEAPMKDNVWAQILASPLRACISSGARLPIALLSHWNTVYDPKSETSYLMPTDLADLDAFEERMAAATYNQTWKWEVTAWRAAAKERRRAREPPEGEIEHIKPTTEDKAVLPHTRIFMYINYLRFLTLSLAGKAHKSLEDVHSSKSGAKPKISAARLIPYQQKEQLALAAHYSRNRMAVDLATDRIAKPLPSSSHFQPTQLTWQPDIYDRVTRILRKRVLAAMRELTKNLNTSRRKRDQGRVLPLTIPRLGRLFVKNDPEFLNPVREWEREEDGTSREGAAQQGEQLVWFDETTGMPASLQASPWLAGSILLHIGKSDIDQLLVPEGIPATAPGAQGALPVLARNTLIPPMIPIDHTYRLPVFSLHRLFTQSTIPNDCPEDVVPDLQELADLINTCPSFNFPFPREMPSNPLYSPFPGDPPAIPTDFLILVKPFAGAQNALIQEIWQLWRYLGGWKYGQDSSWEDERQFEALPVDHVDDPAAHGLTMSSAELAKWWNKRDPNS